MIILYLVNNQLITVPTLRFTAKAIGLIQIMIIIGLIFGIVTIGWLPQLKPIVLNQRFIDLTSLPFIKITDSLFAALFLGILFLIIQLTPK